MQDGFELVLLRTIESMRNIFTYFLLALAFSACTEKVPEQKKDAFDLNRLIGRWESRDVRSNQIEEWTKSGPESLNGKGYVLEDGDTTFIEMLAIHNEKNVLTYFADVSDQNDSETIPFTLSDQSKDRIEFSNFTHDFPKKIVYVLKSRNEMQVYIEGPRSGKTVRVTFDFIKKEF